jgi:hypothetical protein
MTNINKTGDLTVVTISPQEEQRMIDFERQAIENNFKVEQHGATMLEEEEKQKQKQPALKTTLTSASPLEIYRYMKRIVGVEHIDIPSSSSTLGLHSASTTVAEKSDVVTNKQNNNNTNLVLRNLMKKICTMTSPTSL